MESNQNTNMQNTTSVPTSTGVSNASSTSLNMSGKSVESSKPGSDVVFQRKSKKSHGMLYGMILLAILAAGGIGFGVWAMMDGNSRVQKKDEQISQLQSQLVEKNEVVVGDDVGVEICDDANCDTVDRWDMYTRNLAQQSIFVPGTFSYYDSSENKTVDLVMPAVKDVNGHLTVTRKGYGYPDINEGNVLELDGVLSVYFVHVGNDSADTYYYIIMLDGGVNRMKISADSNGQLEKVGDYTKITTVLHDDGIGVVLVDIDGNIYK